MEQDTFSMYSLKGSNTLQLQTTFFINQSCVTWPLRNLFQWSDDEENVSGYASSATISSIRAGLVSANMADNNDDDLRRWMEAQEQTFRAQEEALDNI